MPAAKLVALFVVAAPVVVSVAAASHAASKPAAGTHPALAEWTGYFL